MKKSFLQSVAVSIVADTLVNSDSSCNILVPNQRTRIFLQKAIAEQQFKSIWAPKILTLDELASEISGLQVPDQLLLLLELWKTWVDKIDHRQSFHDFYGWGGTLIRDYDRIDIALSNASEIFSIVGDWNTLQNDPVELFSTVDDPLRYKRVEFWRNFINRNGDSFRTFRNLFGNMSNLYSEFRCRIRAKEYGYRGMIIRDALEAVSSNQQILDLNIDPNKKCHAVGFSGLLKAELEFLCHIESNRDFKWYFDVDDYYIDDIEQEAGNWFREASKSIDNTKVYISDSIHSSRLESNKYSVSLYRTQGSITQVKVLANLLSNLDPEEYLDTLIVLPDESMLFALLNSLPSGISDFNVTMGSNLKQSSLLEFIELLLSLQKLKVVLEEEVYFETRIVTTILHSSFMKYLLPYGWYKSKKNVEITKESFSAKYISQKKLKEFLIFNLNHDRNNYEFISDIFVSILNNNQLLSWLSKCIYLLGNVEKYSTTSLPAIESEILFAFYTRIVQLDSLLNIYNIDVDIQLLSLLLRNYLNQRIAFSGEPLVDLQIMGIFETRNLNYKNVYIMSMNEGVLPSSDHTQSFIPSEFADCFNLPNWKNQHSSDAYIFWRCLQQAHSISLMYSCYDNTGKALSPSRFISQVQYEWPYRNSNVLVSFEDIEIESNDGFTVEPTVVGSELNTDIVRNRISEKGLSATALNSWLNCNRKFYYRYLMGINELESLEFVIDGREEGNWLHLIMCFLYENDLNEVLDFSKIDRILSDVEFQSEKVFFKEFGHNQSHSHGDAVLIKEQIKRRIYEIIQCDRLSVPFQINAVEKEICISIEENGMIYKLCATFDRIEKINDKLCIIDYKTGSIDGFKLPGKLKNLCDDNNLPIIHALFDTSQRRDQKYFDYLTQAFLYILIYWKSSGCIEIPSFSWIAFERDKDMNRKSIDELLHCPISEVDLIAFESLLSNEILLMLSENSNFKLTENADTCKMCDYKSVCIKDLDSGITF